MIAGARRRQPAGSPRIIGLKLICICIALMGMAYHSAAGLCASSEQDQHLPCLAGLEKKVSFDLRDADVITLLDLLARESNVNIVISPNVLGHITIRLENVSRWEALRHVVETMHLLMKQDECVLRIYTVEDINRDKDIIEARLRRNQVEAKQREKEAEIKDKEAQARRKIAEAERVERAVAPLVTRSVPIRFVDGKKLANDLQKLQTQAPEQTRREILHPEKRFVTYNADANSILIRDTPENVDEMTRLIRELDRETRQVLIEAKIVETTRSFIRDLGIQWGFLARGITDRKFPATWWIQGTHIGPGDVGKSVPWPGLSLPLSGAGNWVVNFPYSITGGQGAALGLTFANIANTFALDIQISAAEQNNEIRIISNPRILTSDNQSALIKSGSEIPYQVEEEAGKFKIEFKEAVILLEVTPHIVADDMIYMDVLVKKDEPGIREVKGNPIISKKEAKTRILMKDGDTLIIGGLTTDRHGKIEEGVPWLSRIPVLKHLFSHSRKQKDFEEIMVFITPKMAPRLVSEAD